MEKGGGVPTQQDNVLFCFCGKVGVGEFFSRHVFFERVAFLYIVHIHISIKVAHKITITKDNLCVYINVPIAAPYFEALLDLFLTISVGTRDGYRLC